MPKPNPNRSHKPGKPPGGVKPRRKMSEFLRTELHAMAAAGIRKMVSRNAFVTIQWSNHLIDSMHGLSPNEKRVAKRAGLQKCEALAEMAKCMGSSKRPTKMERVERLFKQAIAEIELLPELARKKMTGEELELLETQKQLFYTTLEQLKAFKQPMVQMTTRQLESFAGLSLTVLKWSLGDKLFRDYFDEMTDFTERLQKEP
ncbi:MAG: hypothetical protein QGI60_01950 [archaeon]|jgi:hypothetical protein|nr:hypothetical protein [archaeon]